jgi:hypothetical protein
LIEKLDEFDPISVTQDFAKELIVGLTDFIESSKSNDSDFVGKIKSSVLDVTSELV